MAHASDLTRLLFRPSRLLSIVRDVRARTRSFLVHFPVADVVRFSYRPSQGRPRPERPFVSPRRHFFFLLFSEITSTRETFVSRKDHGRFKSRSPFRRKYIVNVGASTRARDFNLHDIIAYVKVMEY